MLAPYEGLYRAFYNPARQAHPARQAFEHFAGTEFEVTGPPDPLVDTAFEITAAKGGLLAKGEDMILTLAFYRDDHVLATDQNGHVHWADFIRGPDGRVFWFRDGGRLFVRHG